MNFLLSEKHELLRQLYRDFAINEVQPLAEEIDEEERFPYETVEKMAKCGMLGIPYSKEEGGAGADVLAYAMAVEEMSRFCASTGAILSTHTSLGTWPIQAYGNAEQKEKYLTKLCKGELIGAFGLTEPNAGTDAAGQQTTAVLDGDEYVINGSKIFITNAGPADIYNVMAMTDKSKGTRGISAFIIEKGTPGFRIGRKEKKLGIRASSTCELIFEDCRIPAGNLLGKVGQGFKVAMSTLDGGRIGIASQALGIAQGAYDQTLAYVKERKQFGKPISAFQNTQFQLADMHVEIEAARLLIYKAATLKQLGMPYAKEAAMAKLYASEVAMKVTTKAVQLHGGYGFTREYPVERMMRDAKITEIYEGTSEVQRLVISANILK